MDMKALDQNQQVHLSDKEYLSIIRESVKSHLKECSLFWDKPNIKILDIAPQDHEGAKEFFKKAEVFTLDIDPLSGADYIDDITKKTCLDDNSFDCVICAEVLEHVSNPFKASDELYRISKSEVWITTPFNFRIHGPLPDNWRFTEHGLRELFKKFTDINISQQDSERFLMPIHYKTILKK